jgi:hypothetical protein
MGVLRSNLLWPASQYLEGEIEIFCLLSGNSPAFASQTLHDVPMEECAR